MVRHLDYNMLFFFLMIRRPPRSTLDRSSAASDVYKRQTYIVARIKIVHGKEPILAFVQVDFGFLTVKGITTVSYTHLRAHETVLDLVCRLLLEKKKNSKSIVSSFR